MTTMSGLATTPAESTSATVSCEASEGGGVTIAAGTARLVATQVASIN
jgi:hypothetical protein